MNKAMNMAMGGSLAGLRSALDAMATAMHSEWQLAGDVDASSLMTGLLQIHDMPLPGNVTDFNVESLLSPEWTRLNLRGPLSRRQATSMVAFVILSALVAAVYLSPEQGAVSTVFQIISYACATLDISKWIAMLVREKDDRDSKS
jgi:hypothetical protein